jgi:hypothetical protein
MHYLVSKIKGNKRGFVLPFTMLLTTLILFVLGSSMSLISKQVYFSKLYRESQSAYYAADDAMACTILIDDTYVGDDGLGIFPSSTTTDPSTYIDSVISYVNTKRTDVDPSAPIITRTGVNAVKCAQSPIFDPTISKFAISGTNYVYHSPSSGDEEGKTVSFRMYMDLGIDPYDPLGLRHIYRCAKITVNKTTSFRQIISQGYSNCDGSTSAVERAVVNTTISN